MSAPLSYWIKERHNPQTGVCFIPMGQMKATEAKKSERPLYGTNYMHRFYSKDNYDKKIITLKADGARVI